MLDQSDSYVTADGRTIGGVVMEMKNITLRFGGVVAIKDISFDIREGEIRAIIGPNGAGKSSMLNVISGFYVPQEGTVEFHGKPRPQMRPYEVAQQGIARTFQNLRLIRRITVLENVLLCFTREAYYKETAYVNPRFFNFSNTFPHLFCCYAFSHTFQDAIATAFSFSVLLRPA